MIKKTSDTSCLGPVLDKGSYHLSAPAVGRVVIVSSQLPELAAGPAEVQTDVIPATGEEGDLWFGWSGKISERKTSTVSHRSTSGKNHAMVDLSQRDYDDWHAGYASKVLRPLLHHRSDLVQFSQRLFDGYLRVNELFAEVMSGFLEPSDTIWVHDYPFFPLGEMLRRRGVKNPIGFFLHSPLPDAGVLATLPAHRKIFEPMAGYDLVGVQTQKDRRALEDYFLRELGAQARLADRLRMVDGRTFRLGVFPASVATRSLAGSAAQSASSQETRDLNVSLGGKALIIGVDPPDYTQGLLQKFHAFAHLLESRPELAAKITLMQIAPCSGHQTGPYTGIRKELERYAGHLNGKFATPEWVPLRYINRSVQPSVLVGYYRAARVALVTPLRDGMSLVAKEYIACQDPSDPGVLVLSRFAGGADELEGALLVNPADTKEVADALLEALRMPLSARRNRWRTMMRALHSNDVENWRHTFLSALLEQGATRRDPHVTAQGKFNSRKVKAPLAVHDDAL